MTACSDPKHRTVWSGPNTELPGRGWTLDCSFRTGTQDGSVKAETRDHTVKLGSRIEDGLVGPGLGPPSWCRDTRPLG